MPSKRPVELSAVWTLEGPFFSKDIRKTVRGNIHDMLVKAAAAMEADVKGQIAAHAGQMPRYSGWSWAHTEGYTVSPYTGNHWALNAAVNAVTAGMSKEAIKTKAAAATIERRWHPYRNVQRTARRILRDLDFVKGLNG